MTPLSDAFVLDLAREFPSFRVVPKSSSLVSRIIDVVLRVVTLGAQREFMTRYHTVLRNTLYVPSAWNDTPDLSRLITLRHERVHLRQRRRYGDIVMTILYLVPFFPLGLAYGRARIEWEAYEETLRATSEIFGIDAARSLTMRAHIVRQFTGPAYGWMWPFQGAVQRWYDDAIARIAASEAKSRWDHE